ncbi:12494_t:CDS:2 [Rhizophagus irregularis]|nr:12494_t:CDS:2 [Rhizophagus irregularis]
MAKISMFFGVRIRGQPEIDYSNNDFSDIDLKDEYGKLFNEQDQDIEYNPINEEEGEVNDNFERENASHSRQTSLTWKHYNNNDNTPQHLGLPV